MPKSHASSRQRNTRAGSPNRKGEDEAAHAARANALLSATRILVDLTETQSALSALLETICTSLGWDVGEAWWRDPVHDRLTRISQWCADDLSESWLVDGAKPSHLDRSVGLPGKVWETGQTAWSQQIENIKGFVRTEAANEAGLRSAFAFPIRLRREVLGVLVFFAREERVPDQNLMDMMEILGSQIGVFVERSEIETHLAESEQRLRLALQAGRLGAWEWDIESGRVEWSETLEKIHGIPAGSFAGTFDAFIRDVHPDDREAVSESIKEARDFGKLEMEYRIVRPDGLVRWLGASGRLLRSPTGQPSRLVGVCSDITERRQHEERMARLAAIVESSDDAIIGKDLDGIVTSWNRAAERMYGYTASEMIGQHITAIMPDDRKPEEGRIMALIRSGQKVDHYDTVRQHKEGWLIVTSVTVSPIIDGGGNIVGASGINRDVTAVKRQEQSLALIARASEVLAATLQDRDMMLAAVGRLIVPLIADWCSIDLVNEDRLIECAAVIHDDPTKVEAVLKLRHQHRIDPAGGHAIPKVIRTSRTEAAFRVSDKLIAELSHDETIRRVLMSLGIRSAICVPIVARGSTLGAITIATAESGRELDETSVELCEELGRRVGLALDNANLLQQLERSLESKDEFLGLMSHELRTPITAIYGGARLLRTRGESLDRKNREQVLSDIESESERMFRMTENLLALSRTELGEQPPLEPVLVQRIIKKVVASHRERYPHRSIVTDLAEDIRPVVGLSTYVEQVVRNILGNAEKYTPNDAPITIGVRERDGTVLVSVTDSGPGLEESEAQMIFERFYRAHGDSRLRGLGLGLTVCKRLVEAMGGTIWAERQEPNGLKISFDLPVCGEETE